LAVPKEREIEVPLLKVIDEAGGQLRMLDAVDRVARYFPELTKDDMLRRLSSGRSFLWRNRVQWVRQHLVSKGELDRSVRGMWIITSKGKARLEQEWQGWNRAPSATTKASEKQTAGQERLELVGDEKDLYDPVLNWLRDNWGKEVLEDGDEYWIHKTAFQARKGQPGRWSRPDIMSVQVSRFDILPRRSVEVTTFEVKRLEDSKDVKSVYEAASHQRWGHYSYLVAETTVLSPSLPEYVLSEATRFGVGIMTARKEEGIVKDEFSLEEVLAPRRQEPAPRDLDDVLKDFFSGDERELRKLKDLLR
jgi:hypothetical protein